MPFTTEENFNALDDAVDFLKEYLETGPKPQVEIMREAKDAGISPKTLTRAKLKLKITSNRLSIGNGGGGYWGWSLPPQESNLATINTPSTNNPVGHLAKSPGITVVQGIPQQCHVQGMAHLPEPFVDSSSSHISQDGQPPLFDDLENILSLEEVKM